MSRRQALSRSLPPREEGISAHRWLCGVLRAEILEGRLRPKTRLPATRTLAREYRLSRGTVVTAFDQLRAEGYIRGVHGSGTYVNDVLPDELLQVARARPAQPFKQTVTRRRLADVARRVVPLPDFEQTAPRAFRANQPAVDLFPTTLWAQVASRRLRRASMRTLIGGDALGYSPLKEAIADYVTTSRGVRCEANQVAIISGVQEALDLTARLVLNAGDAVCIEEPGYIGAALVFAALGAKVVRLPLDAQGMVLPRTNHRSIKLAYVTPAHQFPTGTAMSLTRRLELLEWASRAHALIFEDDYDSEFRYSGAPLPALQGLDRRGSVIFAGSFSKVLFPSLRLGYLVLPADLVDRFAALKSITSRHAPMLDQAILCDFITEGHFGRHIRRMREAYAERLGVLLACARERLTGLLEISDVEAGLQTVGWLARGISGTSAARAAATRSVEITPLSRYGRVRDGREGVHLGFAAVDPAEIRRGVSELAAALESANRRGR